MVEFAAQPQAAAANNLADFGQVDEGNDDGWMASQPPVAMSAQPDNSDNFADFSATPSDGVQMQTQSQPMGAAAQRANVDDDLTEEEQIIVAAAAAK